MDKVIADALESIRKQMAVKLGKQDAEVAGTNDLPDLSDDTAEEQREEGQEEEVEQRPRFRVAPKPSNGRGGPTSSRVGGSGASRFGARKSAPAKESPYQRVTGLYENDNGSLGGKTTEEIHVDTEFGEVYIPEGVPFRVFENNFKKGPKDPAFNLVFMKEAPQQRGGGGGGRRFGRR